MSCVSTIDVQTRLDVQELLSRFSHFLDRGDGQCFSKLFAPAGAFCCHGGTMVRGSEALAEIPKLVQAYGGGNWRHLISSIMIDRTTDPKTLTVRAYGPVLDVSTARTVAFHDYEFVLGRGAGAWRIRSAKADSAQIEATHGVGAVVARPALAQHALQ